MKLGNCNTCKHRKLLTESGLCEQCLDLYYKKQKQQFLPHKTCKCSPDCKTIIPDYGDNKFAFGHQYKGSGNPNWKGGRTIDSYGYVKILSPNHPFKDSKGYVKEHRLVMENHLGRYLRQNELVHHRDENKQNNKIENLQLITRSAHQNHHNPRKGYRMDYDGVVCLECGADTTYPCKNGQPHWCRHPTTGAEYVCEKCYKRISSQVRTQVLYRRKKDISNRVCLGCGARKSESKSGQSTWRSHVDQETGYNGFICKHCFDTKYRQ